MLDGSPRNELVNPRAREAVRDLMSGTTLHDIDLLWQDELFAPVSDDPEPVGGQRVTHFQGYLDRVDWTDPGQVARALRVFEAAVAGRFIPGAEFPLPDEILARLRRLFARDGYTLNDDGTFVGGPLTVIAPERLSSLTDSAVIREHLDRIERAVVSADPAQAIGSAKELIESTAKLVLAARAVEVPSADKLPELVRRAEMALLIHPTNAAPGPDGSNSVKKILGAATTITAGVAELRNAGYGTGHGGASARSGLGARHARLVLNAARLWCEFILDTLTDQDAPWRKDTSPDQLG